MCIITKITQFLEVHKQLPEISLGTITQKAKPRKECVTLQLQIA
jgi:hypothetical protein